MDVDLEIDDPSVSQLNKSTTMLLRSRLNGSILSNSNLMELLGDDDDDSEFFSASEEDSSTEFSENSNGDYHDNLPSSGDPLPHWPFQPVMMRNRIDEESEDEE